PALLFPAVSSRHTPAYARHARRYSRWEVRHEEERALYAVPFLPNWGSGHRLEVQGRRTHRAGYAWLFVVLWVRAVVLRRGRQADVAQDLLQGGRSLPRRERSPAWQ